MACSRPIRRGRHRFSRLFHPPADFRSRSSPLRVNSPFSTASAGLNPIDKTALRAILSVPVNPLASSLLAIGLAIALPLQAQFAFERRDGEMTVTLDDKPLAVYVWNDQVTTRPYFKNVHAPDGTRLTRNYPPGPDDIQDHETYHPGIWWGFGDIDGNDYWRLKARVIGGEFIAGPTGGRERAHFAVRNRLLTNGSDEEVFVEQICRYTFFRRENGVLLIAESRFLRQEGPFWMGDQEEMGLAFRVASELALSRNPESRIESSGGHSDISTLRTTQSDWADYSGPLENRHAGMMLLSAPSNFRKPWWHAVDTGLLVANAFGESELSGKGKRRQSWLVPAKEPFTLRYGVFLYSVADRTAAKGERVFEDFVRLLDATESSAKRSEGASLPRVPEGFKAEIFASEPLVFKPTALAFDERGRLFVGQGPQYPHHHETFPTDSIHLLVDRDGDGKVDEAREFARGFNSVQGLAWKGRDLYVANAPELTVVRDLDGDDVADEYVVIYTDLGNREHALHGLVWGPDGKLYMSKGNSKGHNQPERFGVVAPRPFRELWDAGHPPDAPDFYPPRTYTRDTYRKTYHDSDDDWGREGGILRCNPMGSGLEIVARGMRNPWDIATDAGFDWLGTDNDQNQGDKVIAPFFGAHFGWGHPYSNHWTGRGHLPTVPMSGPVFHGSGAGIVYYSHPAFPPAYRDIFYINDWMQGTLIFRPAWEGALRVPVDNRLESFALAGDSPYRPTDIVFGPDGSLYSCGWGHDYHYQPGREGSWIFRIFHESSAETGDVSLPKAHRTGWTLEALIDDLGTDVLPARRIAAQDEILRRGLFARDGLIKALESRELDPGESTWALWTLGRLNPADPTIHDWFKARLHHPEHRIQSLRIMAYAIREGHRKGPLPDDVRDFLTDPDPRLRFEAIAGMVQAKDRTQLKALADWLPHETDRIAYYAAWGAIRDLMTVAERQKLLEHSEPAVRLAALLGILEEHRLSLEEAMDLVSRDDDNRVRQSILLWTQNPRPPNPIPVSQSRIEQETSFSTDRIIERIRSLSVPEFRPAYLALLSRTPPQDGDDWRRVRNFYRSLDRDSERALVLPGLCFRNDALSLIWDALGGNEELIQAAREGLDRLFLTGRVTPEDASAFLLKRLSETPKSASADGAVRAMADLRLPKGWIPPEGWDTQLLARFEETDVPAQKDRILRLLSQAAPEVLNRSRPVQALAERLTQEPDPRIIRGLLALAASLNIEFIPSPEHQASMESVLALVPNADPEEGRHLFQSSQTGCTLCHRVQGVGSHLGPDLSGGGLRSDAATLARSILEPDAAITEGYNLLRVDLQGRSLLGAVLEETDSELILFDPDGRIDRVPKTAIQKRERLTRSVMPSSYALLGNQAIADLVAFLSACRHPSTGEQETANR